MKVFGLLIVILFIQVAVSGVVPRPGKLSELIFNLAICFYRPQRSRKEISSLK